MDRVRNEEVRRKAGIVRELVYRADQRNNGGATRQWAKDRKRGEPWRTCN